MRRRTVEIAEIASGSSSMLGRLPNARSLTHMSWRPIKIVAGNGATPLVCVMAATCLGSATSVATSQTVAALPGMPEVVDVSNVYSETAPDHLAVAVRDDPERVYVPNLRGDTVSVIDPRTMKVVATLKVGHGPQHVVPSYDLRTLWVTNNAERRTDGSLTPIDPRTGKTGKSIAVDDPYNMYFTPNGKSAIVVAEARRRLDFRDPHTMALQDSIAAPKCAGINHADFSIDGRHAIFTCEFDGSVAKVDLVEKKVIGYLKLKMPKTRFKDTPLAADPDATEICTSSKGMPQDIRISPDGKRFYVADMEADGVHILDGDASCKWGSFRQEPVRTVFIRVATARVCMWRTAARTRFTAHGRVQAALQ
jgi:YVTN family beta-propeller protein